MAKRKKVSWIANSQKHEFHRIVEGEPHPERCHLESIPAKRRVFSRTAKALRLAGYDAAKWCSVRFISHENT